jgi:probable phosphoglycerate mutase
VNGGEDVRDVGARALRVIERVSAARGDVVLFSHGHFLRILAATWLGLPAESGRLFGLDTGALSILGYEREARVIRLWNYVGREQRE